MELVNRAPTLAQSLASYIPAPVLRRVLDGKTPLPGETEIVQAVTLLADLSGLTPLVEAFGRDSLEALNQLLMALTDPIIAHGGIIASFDGDAITAYFPLRASSPDDTALSALACAAEMQTALHQQTREQNARRVEIGLRIGLGVGPLSLMTVGEAGQWLQLCVAGTSLQRAINATQAASRNSVIAHVSLHEILGDRLPVSSIQDAFYTVNLDSLAKATNNATSPMPDIDVPAEHEAVLRTVIPDAILRSLNGNAPYVLSERQINEYPAAINMFVAFTPPDYDSPTAGGALQGYIADAASIIHRFNGRLCEVVIGDRGSLLYILFGADAEQTTPELQNALNCALALQRASFAGIWGQRIGITQGRLFLGSVGSSTWRAYVAIGSIAGVALRLCERAQPGQTVVDGQVEAASEADFQFASLPALMLKGRPEPIQTFLLEGLHTVDADLAARYLLRKTKLIGRTQELAQLGIAIEQAWAGQGRLVSMVGPAGVGKSRLIEEIVAQWSTRGGNGYAGVNSPFGSNAPYFAWSYIWSAIFGFHMGDEIEARREKVANVLHRFEQVLAVKQSVALTLFCRFLDLPGGPTLSEIPQEPYGFQQLFFDISFSILKQMAKEKPLLLVFDNMQWSDTGTQDFLDYVTSRIADVPILVVIEHRPLQGIVPGLARLSPHLQINVPALTPAEGWQLIEEQVGKVDWPPVLRAKLATLFGLGDSHDHTGDVYRCNPLAVEQILRYMTQTGLLQATDNGYKVTTADPTLPQDAAEAIQARIDKLDVVARTVLQIAAAVGAEFILPIIKFINTSAFSDEEYETLLDRLNSMNVTLLVNRQSRHHRRDRFCHVQIQETIYQSLPSSRRRSLHLLLAQELAKQHSGHHTSYMDTNSALIAFHYDQAEQILDAARFSVQAGSQAQALYANQEALHHFAIAERNLNRFRGTETAGLRQELALHRGMLYTELAHYDEALTEFNEALTSARNRNDTLIQVRAQNEIARVYLRRNEPTQVLSAVEKSIPIAEKYIHTLGLAEALYLQGEAHYKRRDHQHALQSLRRALKLSRDVYALELSSHILDTTALIHFEHFDFDQALQNASEAVSVSRAVGNKPLLAKALGDLAVIEYYLGNGEDALNHINEATTLARQLNQQHLTGHLMNLAGRISCYMGQYKAAQGFFDQARQIFEQAKDASAMALHQQAYAREYIRDHNQPIRVIETLEAVLPVLRERSTQTVVIESLLTLADSYIRHGELLRANDQLQQIDALIAEGKHYWYRPEAYLLKTHLAIAENNFALAYKHASAGLGAVGDLGDVRMLAALYRLLALLIERDRERIDDCRDALERAIAAGRARARRLDLALALRHTGLHFKRYSNRPTLRAKGSGYLFEADRMFTEMDVPVPRDTLPGQATQEITLDQNPAMSKPS